MYKAPCLQMHCFDFLYFLREKTARDTNLNYKCKKVRTYLSPEATVAFAVVFKDTR